MNNVSKKQREDIPKATVFLNIQVSKNANFRRHMQKRGGEDGTQRKKRKKNWLESLRMIL